MVYQLREEVKTAKKAAMGEMYQLAKENIKAGEKVINFASGHPSAEAFPDELIRRYMSQGAEDHCANFFQYEPAGYVPLRNVLREFVDHDKRMIRQEDDVLVTYGSTEAVYLAAMAFVNPGDKVIVEEPSYVNAIKAFQYLGAEVIGVPMEKDGVSVEALENMLKMYGGGVSLLYTIPNFANPSGITMSCQKRKALYELAVKYEIPVLEDNIYGELRYQGERLPNIKEFDTEGVVIYVGSVSKIIAPAMRTGFMIANKEIVNHVISLKETVSDEVAYVMQYAMWKMLAENDMRARIQKICDIYARKLFQMEGSMDKYFPPNVKRSSPDGGMYLWVTLPEGSDVRKFCRESAIQLHIPITPGNEFCVTDPEKCTSMRFNFVKESMEDIACGIEKSRGVNEMLQILSEFRKKLDDIMLQAMHDRILLYGYDSYTGRFIKWYAEYYHGIKIDYLLSTDTTRNGAYDQEIFRPNLLKFHYKDVNDVVIWVAEPITEDLRKLLDEFGRRKKNKGGGVKTYFDFYEAIYGEDVFGEEQENVDVFHKTKEGRRDIQFLEWLEWKYGCNFVTRIKREYMEVVDWHGAAYGCSTQKEIFPILDHCHCIPQEEDAIFDFGCGKGGALVSFLDYGFKRVGGVEYEPKIFDVLKDNIYKLGLENKAEVIYGDAGELTVELDRYNWFFFWQPFDATILDKCMRAICDSYRRKSRKIYMIYIAPVYYESVERIGSGLFRLTNQFTVDMQSRVVDIYESYEND